MYSLKNVKFGFYRYIANSNSNGEVYSKDGNTIYTFELRSYISNVLHEIDGKLNAFTSIMSMMEFAEKITFDLKGFKLDSDWYGYTAFELWLVLRYFSHKVEFINCEFNIDELHYVDLEANVSFENYLRSIVQDIDLHGESLFIYYYYDSLLEVLDSM